MSDLPNSYKSNAGDIAATLKGDFYKMQSGTYDTTIREAEKKWKQHKNAILKGEESIVNFKRNCPIFVRDRQVKVLKEKGAYYVRVSLVSKEYQQELGLDDQKILLHIRACDKTQRVILDRLIDGTYKIGQSQLLKVGRKWFINLTYQFEKEKIELDPDNIMGVDMGIVYPVYMAFNNSLNRYYIKGGEIDSFRKRVEARRNSLLEQGKYCGDGRRGHGRAARIKPIEKLRDKIANFRKTTDHKYARYVVDMAVKHGCGTIQLEDLSGISKDNKFLANWPYYDLQQKIKYKAEEKGIRVVFVDPSYTSQRCSKCGHIHKDNRNIKVDQEKFKCVACGFETNADYNAAKNLSVKDIDKIIAAQLSKA